MTLDDRARSAVDELRNATHRTDPGARMAEIPRRLEDRRRQRIAATAVLALVVAAVFVGFALGRVAPGTVGRPAAVPPSASPDERCTSEQVTCLGARSYRVDLRVPITLSLPATFNDDVNDDLTALEVYRGDADHVGVTVFEAAVPVLADGYATQVAGGARGMATWLSNRPFVHPLLVREVSIGGLDGYRVDVELREGSALPSTKAGHPAALVFNGGNGWSSAVSQELRFTSYYLLDAPDGGLIVVWSWTNGGPATDLAANATFVESLQFG